MAAFEWPGSEEMLPLNRKERFYTGTVLPAILSADNFEHLPTFLALFGLPDVTWSSGSPTKLQLFTEYSFAESRFTDADQRRFADPPTGGDTPDVVLVGSDWLLAIEAKMFHRPSAAALNEQLNRQNTLIDYLAEVLLIPAERARLCALLPRSFPSIRAVNRPVVEWEVVADRSPQNAAYWAQVLRLALARYDGLRSMTKHNEEENLSGADIERRHADGDKTVAVVGRSGGLRGKAFLADVASGAWRHQIYQVSGKLEPPNPNWFTVAEFLKAIARG